MRSLFESLGEQLTVDPRYADWVPEAPPSLDGVDEVFANFETTGLQWWEDDVPIALSLWAKGRSWYLPWGHAGGNLSEEMMYEWCQRELPGKLITNTNMRFDCHIALAWGRKMGRGGLDFEKMGCRVSDVSQYAALLDDHLQANRLSLDSMIVDNLGEVPMSRLDESRMASYHAGEAAGRSQYNVEAVRLLKDVFWPRLDAENLQKIRALEDKVIYGTVEMEENGAPIDEELLDRWIKESKQQLEKMLRELATLVGFQVNPDSPKDQARVFQQLGLSIERTGKGAPSFTDAILKRIDHPTIKLMRRAGKLTSLRSKFIVNTKLVMSKGGILRYALHQLRAAKDENAEKGEVGTVTGRYSSSALQKEPVTVGVNIQQRMKAAKQRVSFGYDEKDSSHDDEIFLVRKLHVAKEGYVLSSDMDQAQYRIFAHYVNNPRIIKAYQDNPDTSFHEFMHGLISSFAELTYRGQKDLNFAYIFGAGLTKMALMMNHITADEFARIRSSSDFNNPKLEPTKKVKAIYEREVPEVRDLLEIAMHLAKPECDEKCKRNDKMHREHEHRGYVCTFEGRRSRFPDGNRLHKAFNAVDQGTEADYMKTKIVELREASKETGFTMRITNHDELVGDIPDQHHADVVDEILNRQSFKLRVPLTWSTSIGANWAEC